jgi:hypothetical protein
MVCQNLHPTMNRPKGLDNRSTNPAFLSAPYRIMRKILPVLFLFFLVQTIWATPPKIRFGTMATGGFHFSEPSTRRPQAFNFYQYGVFADIIPAKGLVSIRAAIIWRDEVFRYKLKEGAFLINRSGSWELKMNAVVKTGKQHSLSCGISGRKGNWDRASIRFSSRSFAGSRSFEQEIDSKDFDQSMRKYNASINLGWKFDFKEKWSLELSAEQDAMTYFSQDVEVTSIPGLDLSEPVRINSKFSRLMCTLFFYIR